MIELLSLSQRQGGGRRRGRVSYQLLSINQLGAVYEALLSFRGFFAKEDLFEVQPAPKKSRPPRRTTDDEQKTRTTSRTMTTRTATRPRRATRASRQRSALDATTWRLAGSCRSRGWTTTRRTSASTCSTSRATARSGSTRRGTFIYRLAGRDREKSASYYTPQVLTQCLVKYSLKELLQEGKKTS